MTRQNRRLQLRLLNPWTFTATLLASIVLFAACTAGEGGDSGVLRIDFNEYRGNNASLPPDIFVTAEDSEGTAIGDAFYPFTSVHRLDREDSFFGFGAFTADGEDYSFGIRERGETDMRDSRLFLEYRNETQRPIIGFEVSYHVETWMIGERDNRIRLKYHTGTSGYSAVDTIVSTTNPVDSERHVKEAGSIIDGSADEHRTSVEVTFHLSELTGDESAGFEPLSSLAPGESSYLRFQYSNDQLTEGDLRSALALNDIEITPIFADDVDGAQETADRDVNGPAAGDTAGNASNGKTSGTRPGPLTFSHTPGFHEEPFELEISTSLPNAAIYYTLDGSRPDPDAVMSEQEWESAPVETRTRTFVYDNPIDMAAVTEREKEISLIRPSIFGEEWSWNPPEGPLDRAATVRAIAIAGNSRSTRRTATYFLGGSHEDQYDLPVFSLTTERGNFFDPQFGIYVPGDSGAPHNYRLSGREWEREAHVEFFEEGERTLRQDLGVRIHGGFSRALPQKSLRLYSRSEYGTSRLNNQFFDTKELDDFNRILLRNGGNEWSRAMLADVVMQTLVEHLGFDTQHHTPALLFINGEYWGIHKIRDRYDRHFLETNHGVPRDEVTIVENIGISANDREIVHTGPEDANEAFIDLRERLGAGEFRTREQVEEYIEIDQLIDYLITQVYAGNYDWPSNNMRWWRYIGPDTSDEHGPYDGRWRWLMHDLTRSLGHEYTLGYNMVDWVFGDAEEFHPYAGEDGHSGHEEPFIFIQSLMEIDDIRHDLLRRFAMHLATTFAVERVTDQIDRKVAEVESSAPAHIGRWGQPASMDEWYAYTGEMREAARLRPAIVVDHLLAHFGEITGVVDVSVKGAASDINLNSVSLGPQTPGVHLSGDRWEGELFSGIPQLIKSNDRNLEELAVTPQENVEWTGPADGERESDSRQFILHGPVEITIPQ